MTTYTLSQVNGASLAFKYGSDVLHVDIGSAADLAIAVQGSDLFLGAGAASVKLLGMSLGRLTSGNVTFADGSKLLVGDNTTGNSNDKIDNTLVGGLGNDRLIGLGGNDKLDGKEGSDTYVLYGTGDGTDVFTDTGTSGTDRIVAGSVGTQIKMAGNFSAATSGIEAISGNGFSNVSILGGSGADNFNFSGMTLTGIAQIDGAAGRDTITGSAGADVMKGGTGNDVLDGGAGEDVAVFAGTKATYSVVVNGDTVQVKDLATSTNGNDGTDTLKNVEILRFLDGDIVLPKPAVAPPANFAPVAVADTGSAVEDGAPVTIAVLANDSDGNSGDTKTVLSVNGAGLQGSVAVAPGGTGVIYSVGNAFQGLAAGATATETFTYTMADGAGAQSSASVTVTVTGVNDGPAAVANVATVAENSGAVAIDVLANDTDIDNGDTKTVVSVDGAGLLGSVAMAADGSGVIYSVGEALQGLKAGATATETFTYTMADGAGAQSSASVTVTVTGINDGPVAVADAVSVSEDAGAVKFTVLANDTDADIGDTKKVLSVDGPGVKGLVQAASDGSGVMYIPGAIYQGLKAGETATETFTYTMADGAGAQSSAQVTVTIVGANDGPVAVSDAATTTEDSGPIVIDVLANDTDIDIGDTKEVVSVDGSGTPGWIELILIYGVGVGIWHPGTPPILGSVSVAPDGQGVIYSAGDAFQFLKAGQTATETFSYTMVDSAGAPATATVSVTITGANDGPVAVADAAMLASNAGPVTLNVLANDTDKDAGDTKTISSIDSTGLQGSVSIAPNGAGVVYSVGSAFQGLGANQTATETFSYTIVDGAGAKSTATVTVTIAGDNEAPLAQADNAVAFENGAAVAIDVLANDTDADLGDTKTVLSVDAAGLKGTVSVAPGGSGVVYTVGSAFQSLKAGDTATETFSYTMKDAGGAQSSASVTVTIKGTNDGPVAVADAAAVLENGAPVTIAVLANDTDIDAGDTKTVTAVSGVALKGTVAVAADGSGIVYSVGEAFQTLKAGVTATETLNYTMTDSAGAQSSSTVKVTVTGVNDGPVAVADVRTLSEDSAPTTIAVLANDTDVDAGDTKKVLSVDGSGLLGTVSVAANGTGVIYSAGTAFQGLMTGETALETFSYTMVDSAGAQSTATVSVTITGANEVLTAVADTASIHEDAGPIAIDVLANDISVHPEDTKSVHSVDTAGVPGSIELILIYGVGVGTIFPGVPATLGSATVAPDGQGIIYTPFQSLKEGETGTDVVRYTLIDNHGTKSVGTVTVTVTGANDAPVAVNDAVTLAYGAGPVAIDVLANDTDPDSGDTKTVLSVDSAGLLGTVSVAPNGSGGIYSADGAFPGLKFGETATETFTYTMKDGAGLQSTASITVTIEGPNAGPVAVADSASIGEDDAPIAIDVLANDTDTDAGDTKTLVSVNGTGLLGSAALAPDGSGVVYSTGNAFQGLKAGATASEVFTYTMADSQGAQSTATVTVTVVGANDTPTAVSNILSISEDSGPATIAVLANDTDPDIGDTKTVLSVNGTGLQGAVAVAPGGGGVIYTVAQAFQLLNTGQSATETFSYTMVDGSGAQSTANVTVTVVGANEPVVYVSPPPPPSGAILGGAGDDTIVSSDAADIIYGRAGDDDIQSSGGADTVFGEQGDDNIEAGDGNDVLVGGAGRDDLTGGYGADTFRFYLATESTVIDLDRIRDFSSAEGDKIDLSLIDASTVIGGNNAFVLSASFTGVAGQLVLTQTAAGDMLVQGDVNGDGIADLQVEVRGAAYLGATDFLF